VAVSKEGRIFVNFPRWSPSIPTSVAEIKETGELEPYPNEEWNNWTPESNAKEHFVCVQSVYIDRDNYLWILDPANAWFQGVMESGAKLLKVDLKTDSVINVFNFSDSVALLTSYLNDIRVDTERDFAYITDSGAGNLVVVNLNNGKSRRLLVEHSSTKAEDITLLIEGVEWNAKVHADGIALDNNGEYVYYKALTGRGMYRIQTKWLRDWTLADEELGEKVEYLGQTEATDAIAYGHDDSIYLTSIEHNAIKRFTPEKTMEVVVQDSLLKWPDSFSVTKDGSIYVTTAQIHLGEAVKEPFRIFKLEVSE
jgi:sugar lactone lactonase YvrE